MTERTNDGETAGPCPLCGAAGAEPFHRDRRRLYLQCRECAIVFVPEPFYVSPAEEKSHYDQHENSPADVRYRGFLSRLFDPLRERLRPGDCGLDFGCGPGPTLSIMFDEAGFRTEVYDPFYAPDEAVFERGYDFITASEVVEHLHRPGFELDRLWRLLRPGGWLGLMTKRVLSPEAFARWHYITDPTHVAFFSEETFRWLAAKWNADLVIAGPDVVLLRKPANANAS